MAKRVGLRKKRQSSSTATTRRSATKKKRRGSRHRERGVTVLGYALEALSAGIGLLLSRLLVIENINRVVNFGDNVLGKKDWTFKLTLVCALVVSAYIAVAWVSMNMAMSRDRKEGNNPSLLQQDKRRKRFCLITLLINGTLCIVAAILVSLGSMFSFALLFFDIGVMAVPMALSAFAAFVVLVPSGFRTLRIDK